MSDLTAGSGGTADRTIGCRMRNRPARDYSHGPAGEATVIGIRTWLGAGRVRPETGCHSWRAKRSETAITERAVPGYRGLLMTSSNATAPPPLRRGRQPTLRCPRCHAAAPPRSREGRRDMFLRHHRLLFSTGNILGSFVLGIIAMFVVALNFEGAFQSILKVAGAIRTRAAVK